MPPLEPKRISEYEKTRRSGGGGSAIKPEKIKEPLHRRRSLVIGSRWLTVHPSSRVASQHSTTEEKLDMRQGFCDISRRFLVAALLFSSMAMVLVPRAAEA